MAVTVPSASITLSLRHMLQSALDLETAQSILNQSYDDSMTTGTSANQVDKVWSDSRTLAATSETLDLAGSLTDAFGSTVTFVKVRTILIHNTSTTTTEVLAIGGAAGTQFVNWVANSSDIVNIGPDGIFLLHSPIDGYAVGAGASDFLKIDAGADTITYEIIIWGTSA